MFEIFCLESAFLVKGVSSLHMIIEVGLSAQNSTVYVQLMFGFVIAERRLHKCEVTFMKTYGANNERLKQLKVRKY